LHNHRTRLLGITGDRECCAPAYFEGSIMPQSQPLSSVIPFAAIGRPACPRCKAEMMLVSIEPARALDVDLHTFKCAVCNQVLQAFAAYEDPMKSKALGRWLQGDLHAPR
jgi:phage FluMu protein Com